MAIIAIFSLTSWVPQILRILETKDTHSFSLTTTAILVVVNSSWLGYSFHLGSWAFILQQVLTCFMLLIFGLLVVKYRAGGGENDESEQSC